MLNWKTLKKLGEAVLYGNILGSIKTQDQVKIQLDAARELFKQNIGRVYEDTLPSISEVEAKEGDMCILIVDDEYTPYTVVNGEWQKYTTVEGATTEADLTDYYTKAETIEFVNTKTSDCAHKVEDNIFSGSNTFLGALIGNLIGNLTGNADTATKATKDSEGNVIKDTYATKTECNSKASLDATQMLAVNSGITASKVAEYEAMKTSKVNEADIKTVAKTGSYSDLINKPTINNSTINIKVNGVSIGTFTTNSANPKDIAITVPTKMSDLDNDSDYVASTTLHDYVKNTELTTHTDDSDIHVTPAEKNTWHGKQDALSSQQLSNIADVTNKANSSDVVHKSGDETLTDGAKTFASTSPLRIQGTQKGDEFSVNARTVLELRSNRDTEDKSCIYISKFRQNRAQGEMVGTDSVILSIDTLENSVRSNAIFRYTFSEWVNNVPTKAYFEPNNPNTQTSLGSSTHKWKDVQIETINDINPGALSLPNITNGINIDTTNWNLTGVANTFTPASDGYIYFRVEHTSTSPKIAWYINSYNAYSDTRTISITGALSSGFIPVIANTPISVLITATSIRSAKFYPCVGNV